MASVVAKLNPPPLAISGRQFLFGTVQTSTLSIPRTRQGHLAITAKATSESSESSSVVQSLKNIWDKPEDRVAVIGFGIAAIVGFWASSNLIAAIDRLPLIPGVFEFVGILFSSWFVYRYLLFKPDRKELFQAISKSISDILGQ
ncbi:PREDICTED: protein CURVATURE THYLAKOID 1C, chloroplastic isoform X8 [Nicotiana attenuata]|uniref:Protein curvature thylakoid 1c, chloroplastic n=1 Tax=Nicotiana attenuata TaxID=49451 RepID=A0A1J6IV88_NICAT|nr:PREDICTED: protein CURVATURE THYLAKOID 1C, chloroplastic isoform X7 [Nicotiana attenuata]XP_019248036.1 PREDICTED: protein CURVATURE THYLAKOID 1C, chloroplastic isoform X8 [Nicotiana attenuata]OIT02715.1 protein curvature thylakoid 1c, chloroplastic [Nicotiana attenuata]